MNTNGIWLLLLLLSSQPAHLLAASGGEKATRPERMQRISGVITSVTSLDLVVTQSLRKEKKTVRFVLRPDTVKEGELRPGAQVTVEYQVEGDRNVAKRVRVQSQRAPRQR